MTRSRLQRSIKLNLSRLNEEQLLNLRFRDLRLNLNSRLLKGCLNRLSDELRRKDILFEPPVWLSNEWFSPDNIPGIAIPFYLAHPRLMQLERSQMFEVEGGSEAACMKILRHEAGHALDSAYRLHFKRGWREVFGSFAKPYPDLYRPNPGSREFVHHLDRWYAQAHPAEDFAETFAVWLTPGSRWKQHYRGWPALRKLDYVDTLMKELAGMYPTNKRRLKVEPLSRLHQTLREHYRDKRQRYTKTWPDIFDRDLRRIFSDEPRYTSKRTATSFLIDIPPEHRPVVSEWTGTYQYTIDQVLKDIIARCRDLRLRLTRSENETKQHVTMLVTVQTMSFVLSGHYWVSL